MSAGVVWVDETNRAERTQRLRLAHAKARQTRFERSYDVTYRRDKKLKRRPIDSWQLLDEVLLLGGIVLVYFLVLAV